MLITDNKGKHKQNPLCANTFKIDGDSALPHPSEATWKVAVHCTPLIQMANILKYKKS